MTWLLGIENVSFKKKMVNSMPNWRDTRHSFVFYLRNYVFVFVFVEY